jgi:hypothetical protein
MEKQIKCWGCANLDRADLNDYQTESFCGLDNCTKTVIDPENGEMHPIKDCKNFLRRTTTDIQNSYATSDHPQTLCEKGV